ncbi:MAG TPA: DUF790 family protein [Polyangia bacterium]
MLPESLLSYSVVGGAVAPHYLTPADHPWLRLLIDEHERLAGRRRRELTERLRTPIAPGVAFAAQRLAAAVLARAPAATAPAAVTPRRVRAVLFAAGAAGRRPRGEVVAATAASLGLGAAAVEAALFADLPGEAPVPAPALLGPAELAVRVNLALLQGLLGRAVGVTVEADGHARTLVRVARLRGLICAVEATAGVGAAAFAGRGAAAFAGRGADGAAGGGADGAAGGGADAAAGGGASAAAGGGARLHLSGPFALFCHTLLYGRALASLVPHLAWCRRFRLHAECYLRGQSLELVARTGDPFLPAAEPRACDSRLEARFARDFRRAAPGWEVVHEPQPVRAGVNLVFPDFALVDPRDPRRRFLLEIVGFWTPEYLARKLAHLRAAGLANLILCIDEERQCADGDLPAGAVIVRYRRRIDAAAVARLVARAPGEPLPVPAGGRP